MPGFRHYILGAPFFNQIEMVDPTPAIFVTSDQNRTRYKFIGSRSITATADAGDADIPVEKEMRFGVILVHTAKDGMTAENEIDDMTDNVVEELLKFSNLSSNPSKTTGEAPGTRLVDLAIPESVLSMAIGDEKLGRYITVRVQVNE